MTNDERFGRVRNPIGVIPCPDAILDEEHSKPADSARNSSSFSPIEITPTSQNVDLRLASLVLGDSYIKDTMLDKGEHSSTTYTYMHTILSENKLLKETLGEEQHKDLLEAFKTAQEIATEIHSLTRMIPGLYGEERTREGLLLIVQRVIAEIDKLLVGKSLIIPGGSLTHAIAYQITKTGSNTYRFSVLNAGEGSSHHQQLSFGPKVKVEKSYIIEDISYENISNRSTLASLIGLKLISPERMNKKLGDLLYDGVLKGFEGRLITHQDNQEDFITPQRAGTCTWKSIMLSLRAYCGSYGSYRKAKCVIWMQTLKDLLSFLSKQENTVDSISTSFLLKTISQRATRSFSKSFSKGYISMELYKYATSIASEVKEKCNAIERDANLSELVPQYTRESKEVFTGENRYCLVHDTESLSQKISELNEECKASGDLQTFNQLAPEKFSTLKSVDLTDFNNLDNSVEILWKAFLDAYSEEMEALGPDIFREHLTTIISKLPIPSKEHDTSIWSTVSPEKLEAVRDSFFKVSQILYMSTIYETSLYQIDTRSNKTYVKSKMTSEQVIAYHQILAILDSLCKRSERELLGEYTVATPSLDLFNEFAHLVCPSKRSRDNLQQLQEYFLPTIQDNTIFSFHFMGTQPLTFSENALNVDENKLIKQLEENLYKDPTFNSNHYKGTNHIKASIYADTGKLIPKSLAQLKQVCMLAASLGGNMIPSGQRQKSVNPYIEDWARSNYEPTSDCTLEPRLTYNNRERKYEVIFEHSNAESNGYFANSHNKEFGSDAFSTFRDRDEVLYVAKDHAIHLNQTTAPKPKLLPNMEPNHLIAHHRSFARTLSMRSRNSEEFVKLFSLINNKDSDPDMPYRFLSLIEKYREDLTPNTFVISLLRSMIYSKTSINLLKSNRKYAEKVIKFIKKSIDECLVDSKVTSAALYVDLMKHIQDLYTEECTSPNPFQSFDYSESINRISQKAKTASDNFAISTLPCLLLYTKTLQKGYILDENEITSILKAISAFNGISANEPNDDVFDYIYTSFSKVRTHFSDQVRSKLDASEQSKSMIKRIIIKLLEMLSINIDEDLSKVQLEANDDANETSYSAVASRQDSKLNIKYEPLKGSISINGEPLVNEDSKTSCIDEINRVFNLSYETTDFYRKIDEAGHSWFLSSDGNYKIRRFIPEVMGRLRSKVRSRSSFEIYKFVDNNWLYLSEVPENPPLYGAQFFSPSLYIRAACDIKYCLVNGQDFNANHYLLDENAEIAVQFKKDSEAGNFEYYKMIDSKKYFWVPTNLLAQDDSVFSRFFTRDSDPLLDIRLWVTDDFSGQVLEINKGLVSFKFDPASGKYECQNLPGYYLHTQSINTLSGYSKCLVLKNDKGEKRVIVFSEGQQVEEEGVLSYQTLFANRTFGNYLSTISLGADDTPQPKNTYECATLAYVYLLQRNYVLAKKFLELSESQGKGRSEDVLQLLGKICTRGDHHPDAINLKVHAFYLITKHAVISMENAKSSTDDRNRLGELSSRVKALEDTYESYLSTKGSGQLPPLPLYMEKLILKTGEGDFHHIHVGERVDSSDLTVTEKRFLEIEGMRPPHITKADNSNGSKKKTLYPITRAFTSCLTNSATAPVGYHDHFLSADAVLFPNYINRVLEHPEAIELDVSPLTLRANFLEMMYFLSKNPTDTILLKKLKILHEASAAFEIPRILLTVHKHRDEFSKELETLDRFFEKLKDDTSYCLSKETIPTESTFNISFVEKVNKLALADYTEETKSETRKGIEKDKVLVLNEAHKEAMRSFKNLADTNGFKGTRDGEVALSLSPYLLFDHEIKHSGEVSSEKLRGKVETLNQEVKKLNAEVLELATRLPKNMDAATIVQSKRLSGEEKTLTIRDINALFIFGSYKKYLEATYLNEEEVSLLDEKMGLLLQAKAQFALAKSAAAKLQELQVATEEEKPYLEESLLRILNTTPSYDINSNRAFISFEGITGMVLREKQIKKLSMLIDDANPFQTIQAYMGFGKSAAITPNLAMILSKRGVLPFIIVPDSLYPTGKELTKLTVYNAYGKFAHNFEFNRQSDFSFATLSTIRDDLVRWKEEGGFVYTTRESMLCFLLKSIEALQDAASATEPAEIERNNEVCDVAWEILSFLKNHTKGVADEIHSILHCRDELNFTFGNSTSPDSSHVEEISKILLFILSNKDLNDKIDLLNNNQAKLSENDYNSKIKPVIAEHIAKSYMIPKEYLLNETKQIPLSVKQHEKKELVALCKALLNIHIPQTLRKKRNEHYGLESSKRYCIPYLGNNTPNPKAEFASPYETILYTCYYYLQKGIDHSFMQQVVEALKKEARSELKVGNMSLAETKACKFFKNEFNGNLFETIDYELCCEVVNKSHKLALDLVNKFIVPEIKTFSKKLSANPHNLVDMFKSFNGMTGTPYNSKSWNSKLIEDPENDIRDVSKKIIEKAKTEDIKILRKPTPAEQLHEIINIVTKDPDVKAVIDAGALIKGVSNETVARLLLEKSHDSIDGVVYYDKNNSIVLMKKGSEEVIPLSQVNIPPERRLTYYDQRHSIGSDINQKHNAKAFITVSELTEQHALSQGMWRMRQLDENQKLSYIVHEKTKMKILADAERQGKITGIELYKFICENESSRQLNDNLRARKLEINSIITNAVLESLMTSANAESRLNKYKNSRSVLITALSVDPYELFAKISREVPPEEILEKELSKAMKTVSELREKGVLTQEQAEKVSKDINSLPEIPFKDLYLSPEDDRTDTQVENQVEVEVEIELQQHSFDSKGGAPLKITKSDWRGDINLYDDSNWLVPTSLHYTENKAESIASTESIHSLESIPSTESIASKAPSIASLSNSSIEDFNEPAPLQHQPPTLFGRVIVTVVRYAVNFFKLLLKPIRFIPLNECKSFYDSFSQRLTSFADSVDAHYYGTQQNEGQEEEKEPAPSIGSVESYKSEDKASIVSLASLAKTESSFEDDMDKAPLENSCPIFTIGDALNDEKSEHVSRCSAAFDDDFYVSNNFCNLKSRMQNGAAVEPQHGLFGVFSKPIMHLLVVQENETVKTILIDQNDLPFFVEKIQEGGTGKNPERKICIFDLELGVIFEGINSASESELLENPTFKKHLMYAQFLNGDSSYRHEMIDQLKNWIIENGAHSMFSLFEEVVKHKEDSSNNFKGSVLKEVFKKTIALEDKMKFLSDIA